MRRRRSAVAARKAWAGSLVGRLANAQSVQALVTPRAARIVQLIGLEPGRRYVDMGCGTAPYAHLLASEAGLAAAPITLDIAPGHGRPEVIAWPERLPLADASVDALTCLYFIRRFDDDVVHALGDEVARVLAPGGAALFLEFAPVRAGWLDRLHRRLLSRGVAQVDLRGWGRLAALFTESGFDQLDLVNVGPFFLPPIPRVGVLARKAPAAEPDGLRA